MRSTVQQSGRQCCLAVEATAVMLLLPAPWGSEAARGGEGQGGALPLRRLRRPIPAAAPIMLRIIIVRPTLPAAKTRGEGSRRPLCAGLPFPTRRSSTPRASENSGNLDHGDPQI